VEQPSADGKQIHDDAALDHEHLHHHDADDAHAHHDDDDHDHDHGHDDEHGSGGIAGFLGSVFHVHHHEVEYDESLDGSAEGTRVLVLSLLGLAVTAAIQLAVALASGSAGLLADTIHNFSDALTAVPLWLAFSIGRRPATRRYTYGYGRAEDLAGVAIVAIIFVSALLAFWESYQKFIHPTPITGIGWVMAAAVVGFAGNELVAILRIRTGRRIGSAALEADGEHARVDGLTSLGVLVGAVAVWLGFPLADPIVGLLISVAILFVTKDAALAMWHRMMDAVDPALVERVDAVVKSTPGVEGTEDVRLRWLGHRLWAELHVLVDENAPLRDAHAIAEEVRHKLFHAMPRLAEVTVHLDPHGTADANYHDVTEHHRNIAS
jgi:cation diffusion facilitator family transporter